MFDSEYHELVDEIVFDSNYVTLFFSLMFLRQEMAMICAMLSTCHSEYLSLQL